MSDKKFIGKIEICNGQNEAKITLDANPEAINIGPFSGIQKPPGIFLDKESGIYLDGEEGFIETSKIFPSNDESISLYKPPSSQLPTPVPILKSYARFTFKNGCNLEVSDNIKAARVEANEILTEKIRAGNDWEIAKNGEDLEIREPEHGNKVWARFTDDKNLHLIGTPDLLVDGKVGIGTQDPQAELHIEGEEPSLRILGKTNKDTKIEFRESSDKWGFDIKYDGDRNKLCFEGRENGVSTEHLSIDRHNGHVFVSNNIILSAKDKEGKSKNITSIYSYTNEDKNPGEPYYQQANLKMGGQEFDSHIFLFNRDGDRSNTSTTTIQLNGTEGNVLLGGRTVGQKGVDGDIWLFAKDGDQSNVQTATIHLDGEGADLKMGGRKANGQDGVAGQIWLFAKDGNRSNLSDATIAIDGHTGDIRLSNGDCAEDFNITVDGEVEPGTVMVIDEAGGLRPSTEGYDKKVAGVISGAGAFKPGMVLDRQPGKNNRMPIALMGKVYCKVDTQYGAIEVGDLLTTSPTPGYAMKASDPLKAFGTILGKALGTLDTGTGLLPILVTLQ